MIQMIKFTMMFSWAMILELCQIEEHVLFLLTLAVKFFINQMKGYEVLVYYFLYRNY